MPNRSLILQNRLIIDLLNMKFSKILVVFVVLVALVASQTIYDIEAEPWKYDPDFDEDKPYTWKRFAVYTPKG